MAMTRTTRRSPRSSQPTNQEELIATFDRCLWVAADQNYAIIATKDGNSRGPVCKGNCSPNQFVPGLTYKFFGKWVAGKMPGDRVFQFTVAVQEVGHSREAIVAYLTAILRGHNTGIGEVTASRIFDEFGSDTVTIMRTNPAKVASIKALRLTDEQCRAAGKVLAAASANESTKIELMDLFDGSGLYKSAIQHVIELWGPLAPTVIKRDAFRLLTAGVRGAGFSRCDELYLRLGGDPARVKRQFLAGWNAIRESMDGHTWFPEIDIRNSIRKHVSGVDVDPGKAILMGVRSKWFAWTVADGDGKSGLIAEASADLAERDIARIVARMVGEQSQWPDPSALDGLLTDHQREMFGLATRKGTIGLLLGGPGTGKTTCAASAIRLLVKTLGEGAIKVCAPTGKAAVRLTEGLNANGLQIRATTIHRLLGITIEDDKAQAGWTGGKGGQWTVNNGSKEVEADVVIVDEVSMVDLHLMARLFRALRHGTHVLLIGDPYQLPPVGQGAPLRDLIACGRVPFGELTEVKRNDGLIVRTCAAIRSAQPWKSADINKLNDADNLVVIPAAKDAISGVVRELYQAIITAGRRDPFEDVQVLVATNKHREQLNGELQAIVNADAPAHEGHQFRYGDKVICLSNDSYPRARDEDDPHNTNPGKCGLSNGECGRVREVTDKLITMEFDDLGDGPRVVAIPIKGEHLSSFDLAYALTVHKSQGSEWPVVIIVADENARMIASRELWYTAISRAKSRCLIVGGVGVIQGQCRRVVVRDRRTLLAERVGQACVNRAEMMKLAESMGV